MSTKKPVYIGMDLNKEKKYTELLESAWGIIANASNGDWEKESDAWQAAALRWRDEYHALIQEPLPANMEYLTDPVLWMALVTTM